MIGIGFDTARKRATVAEYAASEWVSHIVAISPAKYRTDYDGAEWVDYVETIEYATYYRLLREVGPRTLLVVDECLRTQARYNLTYNCIRLFLAQAGHAIVFNRLPLIDTFDDFMILFDFATKSRWRREPFHPRLLAETRVVVEPRHYGIRPVFVKTDAKTKAKYAKTKRALIDGIGLKDPHTIPRNLHLLGGKARAAALRDGPRDGLPYVVRNQRLKLDRITPTYAAPFFPNPCGVLDFPHNFLDFADFLALSGQSHVDAVVSDLKVDRWYLDRYQSWCERINHAQATLLG